MGDALFDAGIASLVLLLLFPFMPGHWLAVVALLALSWPRWCRV